LATDVYSLGVVLGQLLTSVPPSLHAGSPPARDIADRDLANIVAMATRAEPERRYEDARALAEDLRAWRDGRPVRATADSRGYRLRKWFGRHRGLATASALVALAVVGGTAATLVQAERARREARTAATASAFLADLFRSSDPAANAGEDLRASELLRRGAERARTKLAGEPLVEAQLLHAIGTTQRDIGQHDDADQSLSEAVRLRAKLLGADHPETATSQTELAWVRYEQGRVDEAIGLLSTALADLEARTKSHDPRLLRARLSLADMHVNAGNAQLAVDLLEALVAEEAGRLTPGTRREAQWTLGSAHGQLGNWEVALEQLARVVAEEREQPGSGQLVTYLNDYGIVAYGAGRYDVAREALEEALALGRTLHGPNHPKVASTLSNLGLALEALGDRDAALRALQGGLTATVAAFGPEHPETARAHGALAVALRKAGKLDLALDHFEASAAVWLRQTTTDHASAAGVFLTQYGGLLTELGQPQRGHEVLVVADQQLRVDFPADHQRVALAQSWLALAELELGQPDRALERLEIAVPVLETNHGASHPYVTTARVVRARCLAQLGRENEAAALANTTLAALPADTDPAVVATLTGLRDAITRPSSSIP
jgi:serine/threonine-protein kinase